jgi:hypothetical protein
MLDQPDKFSDKVWMHVLDAVSRLVTNSVYQINIPIKSKEAQSCIDKLCAQTFLPLTLHSLFAKAIKLNLQADTAPGYKWFAKTCLNFTMLAWFNSFGVSVDRLGSHISSSNDLEYLFLIFSSWATFS